MKILIFQLSGVYYITISYLKEVDRILIPWVSCLEIHRFGILGTVGLRAYGVF